LLRQLIQSERFWIAASGAGGIATLVALLIGVFFNETPQTKSLSVTALSVTEIFRGETAFGERNFDILSDKNEGGKFALLEIQLMNEGTLPITKQDYDRGVEIAIIPVEEIYYLGVRNISQASIRPKLRRDRHRVIIDPFLMNPGESFVIEAMVLVDSYWMDYFYRDFDWIVNVDSHIKGVSKINVKSQIDKNYFGTSLVSFMMYVAWIIITIMSVSFAISRRSEFVEWIEGIEKKVLPNADT
jgi:hypothetical protein